jgi:superfamily II DNA or RNA helicase
MRMKPHTAIIAPVCAPNEIGEDCKLSPSASPQTQDCCRSDNASDQGAQKPLFKHNQQALDCVLAWMEEKAKVCVVQPTGTGKGVLAAELVARLGVRTLVLSSTRAALEQMRRHLNGKAKGIDLMTYAKLQFSNTDELRGYRLVILDEFHRVGSEKWGDAVRRLEAAIPHAKFVGLSATPTRHLDGGRDMCYEFFDGNTAFHMTLAEAIQGGILPQPVYVAALFSLAEVEAKARSSIESSSLAEPRKRELLDRLGRARFDWSKVHGVAQVLKKHIPRECRGLVFCTGLEHLAESGEEVVSWFRDAGLGTPRCYSVSSAKTARENRKALEEFEAEGTEGHRLLFSVDMLNEGIHMDSVNCAILLRRTKSPRVYLQQVGRCLRAGSHQIPVIIDLVDTFKALRTDSATGRTVPFFLERPHTASDKDELGQVAMVVHDEVRLFRDIFAELEEAVSSWMVGYQNLLDFREQFPDRWPDHRTEFPRGYRLGVWCRNQRSRQCKLSQARKDLLEGIAFPWQLHRSRVPWAEQYNRLRTFLALHDGSHPKASDEFPKGNRLGAWCREQRKMRSNGRLPEDRIRKLNGIGFEWAPRQKDDRWLEQYTHLRAYRQRNGHCRIVSGEQFPEGNDLGRWCENQRASRRKGKLSTERERLLNEVAFLWEPVADRWMEYFQYLIAFNRKHPDRIPNAKEEFPAGCKLGTWCVRQRQRHGEGKLQPNQEHLLRGVGLI